MSGTASAGVPPTNLTALQVSGVPTMGTGGLLPFTGNYWFVNESTGSDGNSGTASAPFATLTQALAKCTAGNNDVVFLTGTVHVSATVAWSKNNTHLIGLSAPCDNDRSRISQTGTTLFTPLVNVTASGCIFANIATFHGFNNASAQICWAEAGGRNFYQSCQFFGMGDATAAAQAGGRSLTVAGSGENKFYDCTIGLDTITRSTSNASLEFLSGTPRNAFRNCIFQMLTSSASALHVTIGADGIDRYALFADCTLLNAVDSTSTTISAAVVANAAAGGSVIFQNAFSVGATAIATTGPVWGTGNIPTAATSGIAVHLT